MGQAMLVHIEEDNSTKCATPDAISSCAVLGETTMDYFYTVPVMTGKMTKGPHVENKDRPLQGTSKVTKGN